MIGVPSLLGALSATHELLTELVATQPAEHCNRRAHPNIPALGWLLGRAVYRELLWLRERLLGDNDLSGRVRHLFGADVASGTEIEAGLPPRDHLLNWALDIFETHLTQLANPQGLPDHAMRRDDWILHVLLQDHARCYEEMLAAALAWRLAAGDKHHVVRAPLRPAAPRIDSLAIGQGHYRIGAREGVVQDNETPAQTVLLHTFRLQRTPVTNAAWLAFLESGGYADDRLWTEAGCSWRNRLGIHHPWHWRQDADGQWFGISLGGSGDLLAEQGVSGISSHEAQAFASWAARDLPGWAGAVLPHEFQYEAAVRTQGLPEADHAWIWCANLFEPYDGYLRPDEPELATPAGDWDLRVLRGACLHTQPALRRTSYRHRAAPGDQWRFAGLRLVLPP